MLAQLAQLRRRIDELELEFSTLAAAFAETDEFTIHGSYSALDCLRHACGLRHGEAADRLCVGRNLASLAPAVHALSESRIAFGHLVKLARTNEALEGACNVDALLAEAENCSVGAFHYVCEQARHAAKPAEVAKEQAEAAERRRLELSHLQDGMVSLCGVFEPLAQRSGKDDRRRRDQRLADALVELAEGTNPHLMVTVTADTLLGLDGTPGGELAYSPPIPLPTLERLRCDCTLHRVVMTDRSVVIDVGRGRRIVTPAQRRALQARDRRCRWPGCTQPATRCTPHHVRPWSEGGGTSIKGSLMLCRRHHWLAHEGGWRIAFASDGAGIVVKRGARRWNWIRGPATLAA